MEVLIVLQGNMSEETQDNREVSLGKQDDFEDYISELSQQNR